MVPSGSLLALCFFLPALQVCSRPHAPYQAPGSFPPYLFGLLAAVLGGLLLLRRAAPAVLRWGAWLVALGGGGALGVLTGAVVFEDKGPAARLGFGLLSAASLALSASLLPLLRRGATRRLRRTIRVGGALSALWSGLLLVQTAWRDVRYGLLLSLAAALALTLAGLLLVAGDEARATGEGAA